MQAEDYARKLRFEQQHFQDQEEVHDLPEIFHYWSNRHVLPMLQSCGFVNDEDLYTQYLRRAADACTGGVPRFISIGAGNGDLEVRVAQRLRRGGLSEFVFECLETTPAMLERGRESARQAGLQDHVLMVEGDFNIWNPQHQYAGVIANQALHHVVELERLFDEIKRALHPRGYFVTNDMIGRNGHMRWPEALEAMRPFWMELPTEYRWNRLYHRHEEEYINHDCSTEGFEGIRAQDILPLLIERFDFPLFAA
ncbi:MAG: methyltransferase domain-containing protein, partial [Bryobacterales bacterium]|nr:methyltransferase domain-containing protein [Bryobacterales bacterium]